MLLIGSPLPLRQIGRIYSDKKGRRINVMSGLLKCLARFHHVLLSVPFPHLKCRGFQYNDEEKNNNRLLGSLFSVLTITAQLQMRLVWPVCHCNSMSESPGSLFLLTPHCRGLNLNKYVRVLHTSASDGSTTRQSTWKWASVALFAVTARHLNLCSNREA